MFYWSFHPHRTPFHPFRVPNNYIPLLLRVAPIIVEFGPCCSPIKYYLPPICFLDLERNVSEEDNESFYKEIEEWIMCLISDDDEEEEPKRENESPPLSINGEIP
ncbi:hypothetical protein MA16_Dca014880 [Dendrobium catenatum]|uniref:Uncharacterized protein n=1 Tax=Dendrobium catenatum TaxID=906689 RepID=A0A2I0V6V3_9ASPA|nr:hypothetical protein MA16_Dca014880 [Dendrobium catenatum]